MGSWAVGRAEEAPEGLGRSSQDHWCSWSHHIFFKRTLLVSLARNCYMLNQQ